MIQGSGRKDTAYFDDIDLGHRFHRIQDEDGIFWTKINPPTELGCLVCQQMRGAAKNSQGQVEYFCPDDLVVPH